MATRLLAKRHVVGYLPSLRSAVSRVRNLSTYKSHQESETVWPDETLGPFGPQDRRFPLPGNTGHSSSLTPTQLKQKIDPFSLLEHQIREKQHLVQCHFDYMMEQDNEAFIEDPLKPRPDDYLECVAQECPLTLEKDFQGLFTDKEDLSGNLTVITMSQKTRNDMTAWSMDVEEEREELLHAFVQGAKEICEALTDKGYWADFIDPSCGKPYLGSHTNFTLFESDERYRKLGFEIEDLGCCKVIKHHLWGTHCYVGCLFTNAPLKDPIIQSMVKQTENTNK